jgi:hypothetical protein
MADCNHTVGAYWDKVSAGGCFIHHVSLPDEDWVRYSDYIEDVKWFKYCPNCGAEIMFLTQAPLLHRTRMAKAKRMKREP